MSNKGSSVTGILGGAGGGSGGITIGAAVSGGTPSTLLWVDSGGLVANGATVTPSATTALRIGNSPANAPGYSFATDTQTGMFNSGAVGALQFTMGGTITFVMTAAEIRSAAPIGFTTTPGAAANDILINRIAAGIMGIQTAAGVPGGWFQNSGGECSLNANYTNGTAAFTSTNLSITVISGRTYNFEINLFISQTVAADGWAIDFNGGTAAMTNFIAQALSTNETGGVVALANATSAALATVINATTTGTTGGQMIKVQGSFVPSGNGTFIVRARLNTLSTGVITVKRGSNLIARDSKAV